MSLRKKFLFALEDETTVVEPEVTPEADNLEIVENEAEVAEATTALEDHLEVLDESVDDIEEMQQVGDVLERTVESGEGATEETAELAEVAIERICSRLNLRGKSFVSLESFGSKNTRLSATKIAVEDIGEKISAAWKAVKAFFARVYEKIKEFFAKIWQSLVSFKDKAKDLISNVGKAAFKSGEYMMPKGYTAAKMAEVLKALKAQADQSTAEAKEAANIIAALEKAGLKGDAEAVEKIISENAAAVSVATESVGKGKDAAKQATAQADELIASTKQVDKTEVSETEVKKVANETAKEVSSAVSDIPSEKESMAAVDQAQKANVKLADAAEADSKKAAETIDKNESTEAVAEAKAKISLWAKIKAFSVKLYGYISSAVTGVFRRITALISFGFKFVWQLIKTAGALAVVAGAAVAGTAIHAAKGTYNAVVKGKS